MPHPSLSRLLAQRESPSIGDERTYKKRVEALQLRMLRIQQGLYHSKRRAIIAIEGFDAAGKGGAIRRMVEHLDPRSYNVVPIGPPAPEDQGRHYLYRFWRALPLPGSITIFDRTWYGRVLVERVEKLCPRPAWKRAYGEIVELERMLTDDGVDLIKIFLGVSKDEQLQRFEERLKDPYKQWKITEADVRARKQWDNYVEAVDDLFRRTDTRHAPWHLIPADRKWYARVKALEIVTRNLEHHGAWIEDRAHEKKRKELKRALARLR